MTLRNMIVRAACASIVPRLGSARQLSAQAWPADSAINVLVQQRVASKPGSGEQPP